MKVIFNGKEYKKNARNGIGLRNLCFDIFKYYLSLNNSLSYENLQSIVNQWHCSNNYVLLSKPEWEIKTDDLKSRYFEPIYYNDNEIYFTTQWGNNGGSCDNINNIIDFAKKHNYNIEVIDDNISIENMSIKNIILYGAPGVGKTHNYQKLISMIENKKSQKMIFESITKNEKINLDNETFKKIKEENRVEFITFHQSYSYEDFIEGFRPNEDGTIRLEDGIFKTIAQKAKENLDDSKKELSIINEEKKFDELFSLFKDEIQNELDINNKFNINETVYIVNIEDDAFRYTGDNWKNTQRMKFSDIKLLYTKNIINRIDIKKQENISGLAKQHSTYFSYFMKQLFDFKNKQDIRLEDIEKVQKQNFYIVIDEINRGNISKIFGELITLIEEDKRDEYDITLPYSKKPFTVPSNLYIIATMNSTDKSIATIDIALRRRFTFLKMKPNLELVQDNKAKEFMEKINIYIKNHLGEDYMLGHSYFMGEDIDLEFIKEYKIKPLLEEYFYADDRSVDEILEEVFKLEKGDKNE